MSDIRDDCARRDLPPLKCFESYVSIFHKSLFLMESSEGEKEADRISNLIIEYRRQIREEPDEQKAWHLFEEFRAIS